MYCSHSTVVCVCAHMHVRACQYDGCCCQLDPDFRHGFEGVRTNVLVIIMVTISL